MISTVFINKVFPIHMSINLRSRYIGMTEHFLHYAKIGAPFKHLCRKGMAESMRADGFVDAGFSNPFADYFPQSDPAHLRAAVVNKHQ